MLAGGIAAGVFGSLLGLGGGLLIVPLLTLGFGLPVLGAVAVSLVAVVATSGTAAAVYLRQGLADLRLGTTLELFSAAGALVGTLVVVALPERLLAGLFAILLVYVVVTMIRALRRELRADRPVAPGPVPAAATGTIGEERDGRRLPSWRAHVPIGVGGSLLAGLVASLFGLGGGIVKVPLMNLAMGVPIRVAIATSTLMIGVTASTGAVVYLLGGGIDPYVAGPTVLGAWAGAGVGSRNAHRVDVRLLRAVFVIVLVYSASRMVERALG